MGCRNYIQIVMYDLSILPDMIFNDTNNFPVPQEIAVMFCRIQEMSFVDSKSKRN